MFVSFVDEVAQRIQVDITDTGLSNCLIVADVGWLTPLQQALETQQVYPLPRLLTWPMWLRTLLPLKVIPMTQLVSQLYPLLARKKKHSTSPRHTLSSFYPWGSQLISDFDVLDSHLVPAAQLFADLHQHKALTRIDYLSPEQQAAVRQFWGHFQARTSSAQAAFLAFWQRLPQAYERFTKNLLTQQQAYSGLHARTVATRLTEGQLALPTEIGQVMFVGFNHLTPAAQAIIAWTQQQVPIQCYWDTDAHYMHTPAPIPATNQCIITPSALQEAGHHLRQHAQNPILSATLQGPYPQRLGHAQLRIEGVPSPIDEVQRAIAHISYWQHRADFSLERTAIVLADPSLQIPLRTAWPQTIPISFQTGYPINQTSEYNQLMAGLQQALLQGLSVKEALSLHTTTLEKAHTTPLADLPEQTAAVLQILRAKCEALQQIFPLQEPLTADALRCIHQTVGAECLPTFPGPGVQVISLVNATGIDFERLICLSMNEGVWPSTSSQPSYLPYSLRRAYGLPNPDTEQAVQCAYRFYRLLQRAKEAILLYQTAPNTQHRGEKSRYLWQVQYELGAKEELSVAPNTQPTVASIPASPPTVHKTSTVIAQLNAFKLNSTIPRRISPSAINTYLSCRLRFYWQHVLGLTGETPSTIDGQVSASQLGSLVHRMLELLYRPYQGQLFTTVQAHTAQKQLDKCISTAWDEVMQQPAAGMYSLVAQVLSQIAQRTLAADTHAKELQLVALEARLQHEWLLPDGQKVRLGGVIDRVVRTPAGYKLVDYKTGMVNAYVSSWIALFTRDAPKRNGAALQVAWYAWLWHKKHPQASTQPQLWPILAPTATQRAGSNASSYLQPPIPLLLAKDRRRYAAVQDFALHVGDWEAALGPVLQELFDPKVPFGPTEVLAHCQHCPFKSICQR